MSMIHILNRIFGVYAVFLVVVGNICCILSFIVCNRIKNNNTFIFLTYLSLSNGFTLYTWNLFHFFFIYFNVNISNVNFFCCKAGYFVQYASLQIVSWLLVLISVEQLLSVMIKHWRTIYFKPIRARLTAAGLVAFFLILNSHVLFTFGYTRDVNGTMIEFCYEPTYMPEIKISWGKTHLFLYSVVPFVLLFLANVALVVKIQRRRTLISGTKANTLTADLEAAYITTNGRASISSNKQKSMNRVIFVTSLFFVIMTLPTATATFLFSILVQSELGRMFISFVDCVVCHCRSTRSIYSFMFY
jgi:hypothetical protein